MLTQKLMMPSASVYTTPIEGAVYYMQDAICRCVERRQDDPDYCYDNVTAWVSEYSDIAVPRSIFEEDLFYYRAYNLAIYMMLKLEAAKLRRGQPSLEQPQLTGVLSECTLP